MANGEWMPYSLFATRDSLFSVVRRSRRCEELHRNDQQRTLSDLEMQLGRVDVAGLAPPRDHLAALDLIAALDQELRGMGVGGDVAVRVPHQDEIAVAFQLAARIGDDAVLGGFG